MGWDDVANNKRKKVDSSSFLKLNGTVTIRILDDDAISRYTHWIQQANGGTGLSVTCISPNCPLCNEDRIAKASKLPKPYGSSMKHVVNVYDYNSGEVKILDKGNEFKTALVNARATLQSVLGVELKMTDMDFKITTTKGEGNKVSYQIIPMKPTPTSDDILAIERYDLMQMTAPKTVDIIEALMTGKKYSEIFPPVDGTVVKDDKVDFTV